MKNLYFIRHGESQANVEKYCSGQRNDPLTTKGIYQAKLAGRTAKASGLRIDLMITSPLSRAKDTAELFANEIGFSKELVIIDNLLLERTFGELEGQKSDPSRFTDDSYRLIDTEVKGAESIEALQLRAKKFLDKIQKIPEQNVLIVGHGAFGRAFRREINGQPYTDEYIGNWEKRYIPNAEIIQLI